jgi:hypothetical protein
VTKSRRSTKGRISRRPQTVPARLTEPLAEAQSDTPALTARANRQPICSDIDGLGAVMEALGQRQFDLYSLSDAEWRRMSRRQQVELLRHQNRSQQVDHSLGPRYFASPALERSVRRAHDLYLAMTAEQRREVLHPQHLDQWLDDRRAVTIIARDFETRDALPTYLLPPSYAIPDEGPSPARFGGVYLTVSLNLETPLQGVLTAVQDLITGLHGPAARRPRPGASPRPNRNKYDDDDVARIIEWYYRQAAGESLKHLAIEAAGPTARHVAATRSAILRQLRWFRQELGIA